MMEEKENLLFEELEIVSWDATFINETWKPKKEELWQTPEGHPFAGLGGGRGATALRSLFMGDGQKDFEFFML